MSIQISIDISDQDLEHFRKLMNEAVEKVSGLDESAIITKAMAACDEMSNANLPGFVANRLDSLRTLVEMVQDKDWQLPEEEKADVLSSLAYFSEPQDLVPDDIPVLGYLDDAIMIELVIQDLSLDLSAYNEFTSFRSTEESRRGGDAGVSRESWLAGKRKEIRGNLRRKRESSSRRRVFGRVF
jgi:uncharacterized membrane protein YkvA (DUF1232 family)